MSSIRSGLAADLKVRCAATGGLSAHHLHKLASLFFTVNLTNGTGPIALTFLPHSRYEFESTRQEG